MKILRILFLSLLTHSAFGQSLTQPQQKAINNYIQLANHLTSEVQALGPSLVRYYEDLPSYKSAKRMVPQYTCTMDASAYYYEEAQKTAAALGTSGAALALKSESVRNAYQKIDQTCKAMEVYFRLKDYETDGFKKFESLVNELVEYISVYNVKLKEMQVETEKLYSALQPYASSNPYHKADRLMRSQLSLERELLDSWTFNILESVHTGWPNEKTQKHILDDVKQIDALKQSGGTLKYPASSMYKSFVESVESLQETKRSGVDEYTFEKQQSDRHSNDLYKGLINYFNNAAVSFYNNFINQAGADGFRGIYYFSYVTQFALRTRVKEIKIEVIPFADKGLGNLKVSSNATPISNAVFQCLSNYVKFMNEGMRQIDNMVNPIRNLNSSASHGIARMKAGNRVTIDYYYKQFELPVTLYQQTLAQSKSLPVACQKPLTDQAETLFSVLQEINQWNNVLLSDAASKQLTKDSIRHVYEIIQRYKILMEVFDERKEHLYADVRSVFESYKVANPKSSWIVSGGGMLKLLKEDKIELSKAKKYLTGDSSVRANYAEIERQARELIANEFTNLNGIQKLGRSNGNCPYTPYEDLAEHSRYFTELLSKARRGRTSTYWRHPYNEVVHYYNQSLVDEYNKFAELSKEPLLQMTSQMQLFEIVPPEKPESMQAKVPVTTTVMQQQINTGQQVKKEQQPVVTQQGSVVHDTVRITDIIRIETVRQDTVYVSRVDTVFVGMTSENMMSMEGYAINNMVLLLDVSGSMNSPDKLPLLKKSVLLLLKMMRAEDEVSIITYSGKAKVALPPTSFKEEEKIKKVIEQLKSEGTTDGNAGIKLAYEIADKNYIRGGNNRIILATDGEFPISSQTFDMVKKFAGEDIFISVFNFGKTTLSAKNLQQLTSYGKGNYEYITRENADMKLVMEAKAKKKK